jgi:hypothetical protein
VRVVLFGDLDEADSVVDRAAGVGQRQPAVRDGDHPGAFDPAAVRGGLALQDADALGGDPVIGARPSGVTGDHADVVHAVRYRDLPAAGAVGPVHVLVGPVLGPRPVVAGAVAGESRVRAVPPVAEPVAAVAELVPDVRDEAGRDVALGRLEVDAELQTGVHEPPDLERLDQANVSGRIDRGPHPAGLRLDRT